MAYEKRNKIVDAEYQTPENSYKTMDFSQSIITLEKRAIKAKKMMIIISSILIVIVMSLVLFIVIQYQGENNKIQLSKTFEQSLDAYGALLAKKVTEKEDNITRMGDGSSKVIEEKLKETIGLIQNLKSTKTKKTDASNGIAYSLSTVAFSFGAIGFVILLIQIAVQFMRYYARLSELYYAQADALRISSGDPAIAFKFIEHFTPSGVELEKSPATIYEKALEAISSTAKNK